MALDQYAPRSASGAVSVMNTEHNSTSSCLFNCPGITWLYAANPRTGALWWRASMGPSALSHWVI